MSSTPEGAAVAESPAGQQTETVAPVDHTQNFLNEADKATPDALAELTRGLPYHSRFGPKATPAAPAAPVTPATPEATPAGQTPATTPETPAVTTPEATPATPTTPPTEPEANAEEAMKHARNWRVEAGSLKEAEVFALMKPRTVEGKKVPGLSLEDAFLRVYGRPMGQPEPTATPAQPATPAAPVAQPSPTAEVDTQISTLTGEVDALQQQITKATKEADLETALNLQDQKFQKQLALQQAKQQREAIRQSVIDRDADAAVATYQQQRAESAERVTKSYPALADKNSEARVQFNVRVQELRDDPAWKPVFESPNWPEIVAARVAEEQGWKKGPPQAATPPQVPPTPSMSTPAQPKATTPPPPSPATRATAASVVTPSATPNGTTFVATRETFLKDADNATPDQLIELMKHAPIDPKLLKLAGKRRS